MRKFKFRKMNNLKVVVGIIIQLVAVVLFGFTVSSLPGVLYFLLWCVGLVMSCSFAGSERVENAG